MCKVRDMDLFCDVSNFKWVRIDFIGYWLYLPVSQGDFSLNIKVYWCDYLNLSINLSI